eukprot:TRINITY_DN45338_c0_g1_i1.p1 TRINITY_DN45338_c0_g1~~TRINITY_DN45338_c0_g1_i1.p1  ORF type:complete len:473 (+),score=107.67 TRINITY_DN45338_c0_g1_i1:40-1458(+)
MGDASVLRVLNDLFTVHSYDGGAEDAEHGIEQVLKPSLRPCHCSGPGVGHTLTLMLRNPESESVQLTHLAIHGAPGCSESVKFGRLWAAESVEALESSDPLLSFETDSVKAEWSGSLEKPVTTRALRLRFDSTHGDGEHVDVGMVALVGALAGDAMPAEAVLNSGIPADLKVTNLREVKKRKRWMPLESNPNVVSKYLKKLGFDSRFAVHELLSLEPWALEMVPKPAQAVFLLFPIGKETEAARKAEAEAPVEVQPLENVIHMKQLIGNACGTIAVVHVMGNLCREGVATAEPSSWLEKFLCSYADGMTSEDVGTLLEEDAAIEAAHEDAERESEASAHHASNANLHFISFVNMGGMVLELDGRREAPVARGRVADHGGDFLEAAVAAIRKHYMNVSPDALRFNMMALCGGTAPQHASSALPGSGDSRFPAIAVTEEAVAQLMAFGFDRESAKGALEAAGGDVETAANMLLG